MNPLILVLVAASSSATCPDAVTASIRKAHPGSQVTSCAMENETQYEVKISTKEGKKLEVDVKPTGEIIQTEETVSMALVPPAVLKAFAAKYPNEKAQSAVKETHADGKVFFEIEYGDGSATFSKDGVFSSEE
jgi:uncharacterized iron-regulated membrane protein